MADWNKELNAVFISTLVNHIVPERWMNMTLMQLLDKADEFTMTKHKLVIVMDGTMLTYTSTKPILTTWYQCKNHGRR